MRLFKTYREQVDEMTKYGFELAIKYAEPAKKYDKDVVEFLKEELANWDKDRKH